jgi:hypothetical protein
MVSLSCATTWITCWLGNSARKDRTKTVDKDINCSKSSNSIDPAQIFQDTKNQDRAAELRNLGCTWVSLRSFGLVFLLRHKGMIPVSTFPAFTEPVRAISHRHASTFTLPGWRWTIVLACCFKRVLTVFFFLVITPSGCWLGCLERISSASNSIAKLLY